LHSLPSHEVERLEFLSSYFTEREINCQLIDGFWSIHLSWPQDPLFYIDNLLEKNIKKWDSNLKINQIPKAYKRGANYLEALNDNWSLYGWSHWIQNFQDGLFPEKLTIIHLDDHDDLMSPKTFLREGKLYDMFANKIISIKDPQSIKAAILSGAIGIGEFIVPLLWELPCVEIRHLCQKEQSWKQYSLDLQPYKDKLWYKLDRVGVIYSLYSQQMQKHVYTKSSDPSLVLYGIDDSPILLHIDLDYFNNRYDGSSDWKEKNIGLDPTCSEIIFKMQSFFQLLRENSLLSRIAYTTIGISPGFFLLEYWLKSLELIRETFISVDFKGEEDIKLTGS